MKHTYCVCDKCRERVGMKIKEWNVIVSIPVEFEVQVEAMTEEEAQERANVLVNDDPLRSINESGFITWGDTDIVESWWMEDGK